MGRVLIDGHLGSGRLEPFLTLSSSLLPVIGSQKEVTSIRFGLQLYLVLYSFTLPFKKKLLSTFLSEASATPLPLAHA